jgi:hypothetical protein
VTKRSCGSCNLCCRVMGVPEIKQDHAWCQHACRPGGGCRIYTDRPEPCRDFNCMWLLDNRFGPHWYPARARIVINAKLDGDKAYIAFVVDPDYPGRWREEPWFSDIKKIARAGIAGTAGQKWVTLIMIKDESIPIIMGRPKPAAGSTPKFDSGPVMKSESHKT